MTTVGTIIRDAWVFGILPEDETCEGWNYDRIEVVYDKVTEPWAPFGHMASRLPEKLRQHHARIYGDAMQAARAAGWYPNVDDEHAVRGRVRRGPPATGAEVPRRGHPRCGANILPLERT